MQLSTTEHIIPHHCYYIFWESTDTAEEFTSCHNPTNNPKQLKTTFVGVVLISDSPCLFLLVPDPPLLLADAILLWHAAPLSLVELSPLSNLDFKFGKLLLNVANRICTNPSGIIPLFFLILIGAAGNEIVSEGILSSVLLCPLNKSWPSSPPSSCTRSCCWSCSQPPPSPGPSTWSPRTSSATCVTPPREGQTDLHLPYVGLIDGYDVPPPLGLAHHHACVRLHPLYHWKHCKHCKHCH